ncbi:23S rRNA (guanosine(2251)-2'-O)-methyltransferase RlmB [Hydrogenovibrio marinus]|uniref:23S rRNA (guanosine-2'-O-)-methyltransferase RlmB n=1 Tax=Hydrogenovibrio marinus TaxID=28885 RepID=A0A066ZTB0_HYDMR|nr:23S rRNA (guanosine(2251)-2'-O)-methyltransferase RlmB [Hydrogenovibrio marinus]KDN95524.1 23S rRNA methyltransferase [Hydrogenovibrio marinus]BBN60017.1 23S rRNA (guanosine-2'-O-)-methyltransferase RlmB [Hydrogenovibrio marinus]
MKQEQLFGIHAIEKLLKQSPHLIYALSVQKGPLNKRVQALVDQAKRLDVTVNTEAKSFFNQVEGVHQGVIALVAKQADLTESDLVKMVEEINNPVFLFLDEVQDPHNLGAILRTADATGVDAVVIPKHNSVGLNATVRKVACGAAETVKLVVVSNLARTLKDLQQKGMWMTGLAGETDQTIYDMDFKGSVGLVMGAEGTGLRKLTRESCDHLAAIPMVGSVESLNVSVATGVTLYEVYRQRHLAK